MSTTNSARLWIPDLKTDAGRRTLRVPDVVRTHLQLLTAGKDSGDRLSGLHWCDWPREWVQRICREAGVPVVCAHSMRGLHATLAMDAVLPYDPPRTHSR